MPSIEALIAELSDGRFRSGSELAACFGVSRTAIWKAIRRLDDLGLAVDAVRGRGYRLRHPFEPLDASGIRGLLGEMGRSLVALDVFQVIDSTNRHLIQHARRGAVAPSACLAEAQLTGRGRRGRSWRSPYGANLYLSLFWNFDLPASRLGALSLVAGVSVARALERLGLRGHGLKWPNDLLWEGRKLGGILIEVASCEAEGPCRVVIGVGLNVAMSKLSSLPDIDQPWVDLAMIEPQLAHSRNRIAAAVLRELLEELHQYPVAGLGGVEMDWQRFDLAKGRDVDVRLADETVRGKVRGIDPMGHLELDVGGQIRTFAAGEVSLRLRR